MLQYTRTDICKGFGADVAVTLAVLYYSRDCVLSYTPEEIVNEKFIHTPKKWFKNELGLDKQLIRKLD